MATTQADIKRWFKEAVKRGGTHMIVVCDSFDYEDYPVIVMPNEKLSEKMKEYNGQNMQHIMEVYDLKLPMEAQLAERRAIHTT